MKKLLFIVAILISACTHQQKYADNSLFTKVFYQPKYTDSFKIYSNPQDSTSRMLVVHKPDTLQITIPDDGFKSLICLSSTYVGYIDMAGESKRITGVSRINYVTNTTVRNNAKEIGFEGTFDYETIMSLNPDIALIYGINGPNPIVAKLQELNIPYIYIQDYEEQHPLGRAEWLIALGALVGKDMRNEFTQIVNNYRPTNGTRKVMLNAPFSGTWFIPGEKSYMSRLINDAGGIINVEQPKGETSKALDVEIAIPALNSADIWLNPGQVSSVSDAKNLAPHTIFNGPIWNQTPNFYELGASRPDLVVEELQHILNGDDHFEYQYFYKLQ